MRECLSKGDKHSRIYTLPIGGGTPKLMTEPGPSYWHGWSPDGKTLAYCAERNGEFDIYTIPVAGGPETRLTTAPGLDDGPDYSPDGQFIYFNSDRTGRMQVWRMKTDGTQQEPVTSDEWNNWFPHPSPDGKWVVFLSYEPDVKGHPANQDVMLRLLSVKDNGKLKQKAADRIVMKRKNFIKIWAHANNKPRRVKRAAQKTKRFTKNKKPATNTDTH